ncbi:radical SAM protein [Bradyrhizobium sp. INPA01-394B]|uniref:SPASM domain-containing protein n=1 Tax=Bradyrhizobium campsiandrae TaxID=1729892 RepID=A0ABR7U0Q3_9BRAD|nr:SPASM domain-containing protein [Bradyrhizobium campsiandrae]MBC9879304.1 radical SAM protein [Bradyrhizobium campsiandrae]MBC9977561.1 SPASM domain-containing protein [Bradyrhizobium campsiandrae]
MKCSIAWSSLYIQANGKVTPCCGDLKFGDTKEKLADIFNGPAANKLRQQMLENSAALPDICTNCNLLQRLGNDDFPASYRTGTSYEPLSGAYVANELPPQGSKPLSLMVQFGELCNIQCIMCPQDHTSKIGITPEAVERVKEAIPNIASMTLTGGEPTAFKQCWDIIDHFNNNAPRGAHLGLLTNLKSVTKARVEKSFDKIESLAFGINVDAATKETYEYIRHGANWEQLNRNLIDLLNYKNEHRKTGWRLNMTMTVMKSNLYEMRPLIERCGELGIGFGCGGVTGDFAPIKNARTYFEENIFRYPHIGISKSEMIAVFEDALDATECLPKDYQEGARNNIAGMIEITKNTPQVEISPEDVSRIRELPDDQLSRALGTVVQTGRPPWYRPALSDDPMFWVNTGKRTATRITGGIGRRIRRTFSTERL